MIDSDYGKHYAVCDYCGEAFGPFMCWDDVLDHIRHNGWRSYYNAKLTDWQHYCKDCKERTNVHN